MTDPKKSRFLSLILRHKPETIGLTLDSKGWVPVDELLGALEKSGQTWSRDELAKLVADNDKNRFSFSPDGSKIRANQDHSLQVDLQLPAVQPPEELYHGTVERFLHSIMQKGLQAMERHHVHLSVDYETALAVGARRGTPLILKVWAGLMHQQGHSFHRSENGVWLTERVPPNYLELLPER